MKFATLVRAACIASFMLAASHSNAGAYTQAGAMREFSAWQDVNGILILPAETINPDGCVRGDGITLQKTHPQYKEMYAMVLSAHMAGKKVVFYLNGCAQNFPNVIHMIVQN